MPTVVTTNLLLYQDLCLMNLGKSDLEGSGVRLDVLLGLLY